MSFQQIGDYVLNRNAILGKGQYGVVYKGYKTTDFSEVAIKQSCIDQAAKKQVTTLQILNHKHIVKYYNYSQEKNPSRILLFMEYCNQGNLDDLLLVQGPDNQKLIKYYSQILSGVEFMYSKKILHRDLKPANILVHNKSIKIADFGVSKIRQNNSQLSTLAGTPLFCSPQMIQMKQGKKKKYTQQSDIFSLGLILYYMFNFQGSQKVPLDRLRKSLPWVHENGQKFLNEVKTKEIVYKNQSTPSVIREIIKKMLAYDASNRMKFKQLFELQIFKKYRIEQEVESFYNENFTLVLINPQKMDSTIVYKLKQIQQQKQRELKNHESKRVKAQFYYFCLNELIRLKSETDLNKYLAKKGFNLIHDYSDNLTLDSKKQGNLKKSRQMIEDLRKKYEFCTQLVDDLDKILNNKIKDYLKSKKDFIQKLTTKIKNNVGQQKFLNGQQTRLLYLIYHFLTLYTIFHSFDQNPKKPEQLKQYINYLQREVRRKTIANRIIQAYRTLQI